MGPKIKTLVFLKVMVLVILLHFLPVVLKEIGLKKRVEMMKRDFNRRLLEGSESLERLRMLKTLINNARYCKDGDIPLDGSMAETKRAYEGLRVWSDPVFLRLSNIYNISIFFPVFAPVVIQSIKILRYRDSWGSRGEKVEP
ncbi:uncharacterized protein Eint_100950 [Encephalitozoon intestinalis ATCC 50506]|uniref:Uncharacterized protein n=1 Tax=Encephalitozoon intestinalis (strain ATCC 50506) TaxID=876142 RepID=E0S9N6_ENCIT|nr:uncharacterized protein Eint_100950 [Encephalitozoon intestinalis ATCC 50506]ADM12421.1 hypothetical protein Eint_100950 [Encephalitozoon intestinalis ATCC 50506]UTX46255.1 hypothetical protein GPK93_10g18530 [Encephalitozoon intestinalis]